MRLLRIPRPLDHQALLYELKYDGFRALAYVRGHHGELVSRNRHVFKSWPYLVEEIAHTVPCRTAVLDGEIVCLDAHGKSRFTSLLYRREWPFFMAFDLLWLDGRDLRRQPLLERKRLLRQLLPRVDSRLRYVEHVDRRGAELFAQACDHDLEGVVAKWRHGTYQSGPATSWFKVKNPRYSQMDGRAEMFEDRGAPPQRTGAPRLELV